MTVTTNGTFEEVTEFIRELGSTSVTLDEYEYEEDEDND